MRRAASGRRRASVRTPIRLSARKARAIRPPRRSRSKEANRELSLYDPATRQVHADRHLLPDASSQFRDRRQQDAVASPGMVGPGVIGWLNRKMFEETGDEQKSQGWTPFIVDTNGNGKRDDYVEPNAPVDPTKDKRILVNHLCGGGEPVRRRGVGHGGRLSRLASSASMPGSDPTHTALTEIYERAGAGLRSARRRCRQQRRLLGGAGERPSRRIRPPQVQGAERSDRARQALPGGLDASIRCPDRRCAT